MQIEDWKSTRKLSPLYRELAEMELLENIAELEAFGFTVVPPEKVGPQELHDEVREAVLAVACERRGCTVAQLPEVFDDAQELMRFVLWDAPIFEKVILNPATLGLIQYLVGTDCILSLLDAWIKGKGDDRQQIHADWAQTDIQAMPPEPFTANFNYLLSDYSKADGGIAFVPGSHRWRRWPSVPEVEIWNEQAHAVEAPAGSMVIWGDHTWHCSFPRTTEGLRLTVLGTYCRSHMKSQEPFRDTATQEALDRNPVRFAELMDIANWLPFGKDRGASTRGSLRGAGTGYRSLFDTEAAAGRAVLRPDHDYFKYDPEAASAAAAATKDFTYDFYT